MNKITKKTLTVLAQIAVAFVIIILGLFSKTLVRSCNSTVGYLVNSPKEPEPIECINELVKHMNTICPIYFESWAKIESFTVNQNYMTIKIVVDDDFSDTYNEGTFVQAVHQQLNNEVSSMDKLQHDMDATQIQIKLTIYKENGDFIETKVYRNKDIFDTIVRIEEDNDLERTLRKADIITSVTPYSY